MQYAELNLSDFTQMQERLEAMKAHAEGRAIEVLYPPIYHKEQEWQPTAEPSFHLPFRYRAAQARGAERMIQPFEGNPFAKQLRQMIRLQTDAGKLNTPEGAVMLAMACQVTGLMEECGRVFESMRMFEAQ